MQPEANAANPRSKNNSSRTPLLGQSIARRLTITLILVVTLVSIVTISAIYSYVVKQEGQELTRKADEYLAYLIGSLELPLWNFEFQVVGMIAKTVADYETIDSLKVFDADGNVIYSLARSTDQGGLERSGKIVHDGEDVGSIVLRLTRQGYQQKRRDLIFFLTLTTAIVVLLLMIFTGILSRKFLRTPLESFNAIVNAYAEGNYDAKMLSQPYVEFKTLEEVLSRMGRKIKDQVLELRCAEEQSRQANVELEERVRLRTAELDVAKDQAESANRAKSEFLARMSHEIRTPMNAITGLTSLLLKMEMTAAQRDYLIKIHESSAHLLRIINDILDFSKIEAGKMELATTDFLLHHIVEKLANMFRSKSAEKGIELFYIIGKDVPLTLTGDPLRLGQILINLISNAVKFTDRGEVLVKVMRNDSPLVSGEGWDRVALLFSVQDSGVGIPKEKQAALFQVFTQLDSSTNRKHEGSGLGLSICHRLVTLMGGRIWVESEAGCGATFFFSLGFGCRTEQQSCFLTAPPEIRGMRVLVVDDNEVARLVLREILQSFDMLVTTVNSGQAALDTLGETGSDTSFDLIVLDWKMQGMDGFQLADAIRNHPVWSALSHMPKIIMVTMFGTEEIMEAKKQGAGGIDAYILKPVSSSELFNTIMRLFGRQDAIVPRMLFEPNTGDFVRIEGIKNARILLVEDNTINQLVAMDYLQRGGLIVDVVDNGKVAVDVLKARVEEDEPLYDLVLMDIEMPIMDGYEATQHIRRDPRFVGLPIVAMTAHALVGDRQKCIDAGMNEYVPKPIEERELYRVLIKLIAPGERPAPGGDLPAPAFAEEAWDQMPDTIAGIDMKTALARISNNTGLFRRMLLSFLENNDNAADMIPALVEEGNIDAARHLTHSLKGGSGNIGAETVFRATRALDDALQTGNKPPPALLDTFSEALAQLLDSLRTLDLQVEHAVTSTTEEEQQLSVSPEEITRIIQEMLELLKEGNSRVMYLFPQLKQALPGRAFLSDLNRLDRTLYKLDFSEAQKILQQLVNEVQPSRE